MWSLHITLSICLILLLYAAINTPWPETRTLQQVDSKSSEEGDFRFMFSSIRQGFEAIAKNGVFDCTGSPDGGVGSLVSDFLAANQAMAREVLDHAAYILCARDPLRHDRLHVGLAQFALGFAGGSLLAATCLLKTRKKK